MKYTVELSGTLDLQTLLSDAEVLYVTFRQIVNNASSSTADRTLSSEGSDGTGLKRRRLSGHFPPNEEDKEEARRDKVRERTKREVDELKEMLE